MDHVGELVADASWECLWSDIASVSSHLLISDWLVDSNDDGDRNDLCVGADVHGSNSNSYNNKNNDFLSKKSTAVAMVQEEDLDDYGENDDDQLSFSSLTTTATTDSGSCFEPPRKKMRTHFDSDEGLSHCRSIAGFVDDQSSSQPASSDQSTWIITNDVFLSSFEDTVEQQSSAAFFYKKEATPESATPDHCMKSGARLLEDCSDAVTSICNVSGNHPFSPGSGRRRLTFCSSAPPPRSSPSILPSPVLAANLLASTPAAGTVVYPFAVVKPSWMQGHVTLQDINERILTPTKSAAMKNSPCTFSTARKDCKKSVIALTKIHTEGLSLKVFTKC